MPSGEFVVFGAGIGISSIGFKGNSNFSYGEGELGLGGKYLKLF